MKNKISLWDKLGYFLVIAVSLAVGIWNYFVAIAGAVVVKGFIGFMAVLESLFTVYVAMYIINSVFKTIKSNKVKK